MARIGPRMRAIQAFASAYPGESARTVVAATTGPCKRWIEAPSHRKALYRAEGAGLVIIDRHANIHRVFASEDDRKRFYADRDVEARIEARMLADVVSALPGCSKVEALRAAGVPVRVLDKAIAAGLVLLVYERTNLCRLFATERDRTIFELRRELLDSPAASRAEEIVAEIETLRREQAQTWRE